MGTEKADKVDGAAVQTSLDAWISRVRRNLELGLRVCEPARVIAYEPVSQKASVRLEFLPIRFVDDDTETPDGPILLPPIPVAWPRAAAGYLTFPLVPNDTGHVMFTDRALSQWLQVGNPAAPVDPINGRTHHLADAFFVPGLHTDTDPIPAVGGTSLLATVLEGPLVNIGALAVDAPFRGTTISAGLTPINTTLSAVPPAAGDPATNAAAAVGNKAAILAIIALLQANLATKARVE